ncbi:MAG: 30S ribosomal protein S13 [Dehalococcoidia bacterium]|jgi:small subunit ribosomal protein S13|nr:30S ribosomal protein S13 [Dehalococcoidia bacterium]MDP6782888.1 30S ribosomal protein S13 [Dehalococcoidia bacterium]
MARIAGVDVPRDKAVWVALRYIHGIGKHNVHSILGQARVSLETKVRELTDEEVSRLREAIDGTLRVEGELRREVNMNIRRLVEIGSYRGHRHHRGLPAKGQRTRTNARTKRGVRRTVAGRGHKRGVGRK